MAGGGYYRIEGSWSPGGGSLSSRAGQETGPLSVPASPAVSRSPATEDSAINEAHAVHRNKWATNARLLPGRRSDNGIKNHWNPSLRRRLSESQTEPEPNSDSDSAKKRPRHCLPDGFIERDNLETTVSAEPPTLLMLFPTGEDREERALDLNVYNPELTQLGFGFGSCSGLEMKDGFFMSIMQEIISREVRSYIERLRAEGGLDSLSWKNESESRER